MSIWAIYWLFSSRIIDNDRPKRLAQVREQKTVTIGVERPVPVLDSNPVVATETAQELATEGYKTQIITDIQVLITDICKDIACVVTEAVFPNTDGIELAHRLRFFRPSLRL